MLVAAVAGYAAAERPPGAWLASWAPTEDWAGSDAAAGPALQLVEAMRSKRAQVCKPTRALNQDSSRVCSPTWSIPCFDIGNSCTPNGVAVWG